jgi:hypothetical protein
VTAVFDPPYFT